MFSSFNMNKQLKTNRPWERDTQADRDYQMGRWTNLHEKDVIQQQYEKRLKPIVISLQKSYLFIFIVNKMSF